MITMTGGEALAGQLQREGVEHVFGIPGVQLDWAVEGIRKTEGAIEYVVPRHEQATSYMADGYARASGKIGTMMVVPGPGLLNAMAGLATAHACNSKVLAIVGQIHSKSIDKGLGLLHELPEQDRVLSTVTKWNARASRAAEIPQLVREAVRQLNTGRPQPVAIEIPHDLLSASELSAFVDVPAVEQEIEAGRASPDVAQLAQATALLRGAKFPVIYAGGGVIASGAFDSLRRLAELLQAPVVMSDNGRGSLPQRHPLALSTLGGRLVFRHADVVLVVGSRFIDGMAPTPAWPASSAQRFVYLNALAADMTPPRSPGIALHGDAKLGLQALADSLAGHHAPSRTEMLNKVRHWSVTQITAIQPQSEWINVIADNVGDDDIVVHEMTQIGYFARLALPVQKPAGYITPGFQGTLGFGFPTALGAAFGRPKARIISLNGDGGFGWNLQELSTLNRYQLNVTVIVFVDGHFGNVRKIQSGLFGHEIGVALTNPSYAKLADAMGVPYRLVNLPSELGGVLLATRSQSGPLFIEVPVQEMPSPWHLFKLVAPSMGKASNASEPPDPLAVVA
jgi:acetolactate synthase I/II/III large subunit